MPDGVTVCNSSCLIALAAIGRLDLLKKLYGTVRIPRAVDVECRGALPDWIVVHPVANQRLATSLQLQLGPGESEAIALAVEQSAIRIILDDKKARHIARQMTLAVTGTLGVLLRSKEKGNIECVKDVIGDLEQAHFYIANDLAREVLRLAGESV